ncbi:hyaluronidase-5-like [Plodia interpunctella]|uniref:hyaluronidase-5-like n=1 Tax=Plodia interpunctella TaxID=58824 RepID=UPI0023676ACE|nr:hyaluronidase-5-like [Plodia interpunctella]
MRSFLFFVLASYAVRCDDNYYVIEMPEQSSKRVETRRPFKVYWNVPTMQCISKQVPFNDLDRFGIIQNTGDSFRGDKIAILYDPGLFPALLKNETSGKYKFRNGGVPQEGNLENHIKAFKDILETSIPDASFDGIGIIDFESWRPVFRQNFGVLVPYKDVSIEIENKLHWWWPKNWMQAEAKRRFEEAGRAFMQTTIQVAKQMRPRAQWGYYGFPYCFNMAADKMPTCSDDVMRENNGLYWLWSESRVLYPSVYSSVELTTSELSSMICGRVSEAIRVRRQGSPVLPYFWFRYREGGFLSKEDLTTALKTFYSSGADGFIIWGSSKDVNTAEKCTELLNYMVNVMGPAIAKYTNDSRKATEELYDELIFNYTRTGGNYDTKNKTGFVPDPDYVWVPPQNYSQNIVQHVKDLIRSNRFNDTDENEATPESSVLLNIFHHLIINEDEDSINKNDKRETTESYSIFSEDYYNTVSTTTKYWSTTEDFYVITAVTSTDSTTTDINDSDTDESTEYPTTESTTQTESSDFETSTTGSYTTESYKEIILDVNMTEFQNNQKLSKNEKKGMPSKDNQDSSADDVDDSKNNKKGLPKRKYFEDNDDDTINVPIVHQVSRSSAELPLLSMPILLVLYGLMDCLKCLGI